MVDRDGVVVQPGQEIVLPDDDLTALNLRSGTIEAKRRQDEESPRMTCPICAETMKRPPRLEDAGALAAHYADKHAGFGVPEWEDGS